VQPIRKRRIGRLSVVKRLKSQPYDEKEEKKGVQSYSIETWGSANAQEQNSKEGTINDPSLALSILH